MYEYYEYALVECANTEEAYNMKNTTQMNQAFVCAKNDILVDNKPLKVMEQFGSAKAIYVKKNPAGPVGNQVSASP